LAVNYGTTAGTAAEGNDSRLSDSRTPSGAAGGDLTGSYPNPTLATVTTAQTAVGNSTTIPVITVNAQGQVTALTTASIASGVALATTAPANLASTAAVGTGTTAARDDHQHAFPSAADVGALGATASAGGDLTGNYPNPTLAAVTTAQSNVGSSTQIPVISVDAKGRVTALSTTTAAAGVSLATTAPANLASVAAVGTGTTAARADHQHAFPTAANVGALGATAAAGGDLAGNYPSPTLAAITTAQSNIGSSTLVPVISVDAKGRVTALSTAANPQGTVTSVTGGTGLTGGTITGSGTLAVSYGTTSGTAAQGNDSRLTNVSSISGGTTGLTPATATTGAVTLAGTLAIANGGTGATTRQAAMDALAGSTTSGQYLRGDGADVVMSAIQAADVPTLNQNTTGTAGGLSSTLAVTSGGTGQTSYTNGQILIGNSTGNTLSKATLTAGSNVTITNGPGTITIASTGNSPVYSSQQSFPGVNVNTTWSHGLGAVPRRFGAFAVITVQTNSTPVGTVFAITSNDGDGGRQISVYANSTAVGFIGSNPIYRGFDGNNITIDSSNSNIYFWAEI
jgi:hypothetical protein